MTRVSLGVTYLVTAALVLGGCSTTKRMESYSADVVKDNNVSSVTKSNLESEFKEIIVTPTEVDISTPKTIKSVLRELQDIDSKIYMLDSGSKNMEIPINKRFKIKSLEDLKSYLSTTTDYTVEVASNKFRVDLPKMIRIIHKNSVLQNIVKQSIPLSIVSQNSHMTAKDALVAVSKETKFSLIFKYANLANAKTSLDALSGQGVSNFGGAGGQNLNVGIFDNAIINFQGNNLADFFSYIENSFDVYVDVDYEKKQIVISQIKANFLKLALSDVFIESKESQTTGSNDNKSGGKLTTSNIYIKMYKELENKLNAVFGLSSGATTGAAQATNEYYKIDSNNGEALIVAGREKLERAREVINSFNENYSKSVYVDFRIYEVLVYNDNRLGSKISGSSGRFNMNLNSEASSVLDFTRTTGTLTLNTFIDSLHKYGHVIKGYRVSSRMTNNIPKSLQLTTMDEYVSRITDNTTTATGVTNTQISNETTTLIYGKTITMKPSVFSDSCAIEIDFQATGKPSLQTRNLGNNQIEIATNKTNDIYRDIVRLRNNETVIVNTIQDSMAASEYSGVVPIENFIIGGTSDKSFLKRETIYIISLKGVSD
ncbi:MAG: hypothetical protein PHO62_07865 [Sulfurimonas sp.]|uniref:hypothetical protein n=1 Tax=Sulfurimonas sp. TaxID=2022749 RepID=UPI0026386726|nr:hypothetical protein [Sulfurimonas sp.]MDD5373323.1 hypothetical protein [Sulfurimonas sp.]